MSQSQKIVLTLPVGPIKHLLLETDGELTQGISILFDHKLAEQDTATLPKCLDGIAKQLCDYSRQAHNNWTLDFSERGTPYQRKVWRYLQTIPMGTTQCYGEVAKALNSSARAVGNACRANPFLLVIPCHRVVKSTGLGGFGGKTEGEAIAIKQWLLAHEKYAK
jgi:methylated-DNA-[protein]-cysteine S-methyltransferase